MDSNKLQDYENIGSSNQSQVMTPVHFSIPSLLLHHPYCTLKSSCHHGLNLGKEIQVFSSFFFFA